MKSEKNLYKTGKKPKRNLLSRFFLKIFLGIIFIYQKGISPLTGPHCRYTPTCSEYCKEALLRYGPIKGGFMGIKRICRCHPFHPGGFDPVP